MSANPFTDAFTLRDDETLVARLEPGTTATQAAALQEHLQAVGHERVILLPPQVESAAVRREAAGRVIITWPAAKPGQPALSNWGVEITDADTGEPVLTGVKISIVMGTDAGYEGAVIEADITALIDEHGNLLGNEPGAINRAQYDETGIQLRTKVFRYAVAEMRVAEEA